MPAQRTCCIDKTGLKTKVASILATLCCHFLLGSLYNYPEEEHNQKFQYPNLGSSLFVLSVALYCTARTMHPKFLCIQSSVLQTIFRILLVIIITNALLVIVWQQMVCILHEMTILLQDALCFCHLPCGHVVRSSGCYLVHLTGFLTLVLVLTNVRCMLNATPSSSNQVEAQNRDDYSDDSLDSYFRMS